MCEVRLRNIDSRDIWRIGVELGFAHHALNLNDVFIIFMEHLFFSKGRIILFVVLVNFKKASV